MEQITFFEAQAEDVTVFCIEDAIAVTFNVKLDVRERRSAIKALWTLGIKSVEADKTVNVVSENTTFLIVPHKATEIQEVKRESKVRAERWIRLHLAWIAVQPVPVVQASLF